MTDVCAILSAAYGPTISRTGKSLSSLFHVNNSPAFRLRFIEALVQFANTGFAIVGPFTLVVGVVDIKREPCAITGRGPQQHLQIAVGVIEGGDGPGQRAITPNIGKLCSLARMALTKEYNVQSRVD